jgi:hypothetical protein
MSVPAGPDASALLDGQGCLTEAGIRALLAAPPGRGPEALAVHLAACGRCQDRVLAAGVPGPRTGAPGRQVAPPLGRMLLLVGLILVSMLLFFVSLHRLTVP